MQHQLKTMFKDLFGNTGNYRAILVACLFLFTVPVFAEQHDKAEAKDASTVVGPELTKEQEKEIHVNETLETMLNLVELQERLRADLRWLSKGIKACQIRCRNKRTKSADCCNDR